MRLLLFSNSTNQGEDYLAYTLSYIKAFMPKKNIHAIFIPYAGVTISFDTYTKLVEEKLQKIGIKIKSIHQTDKKIQAIQDAELIIIGGGNTFQLLQMLQKNELLEVLRKKVLSDTPYIGWSAGANIACPTICTTNDMPIVEPENFKALCLISFQINPHYTDDHPLNHAGETREMRILEYTEINPNNFVVGLREGTLLRIENNKIHLLGKKSARIFKKETETLEVTPGDNLSFLNS